MTIEKITFKPPVKFTELSPLLDNPEELALRALVKEIAAGLVENITPDGLGYLHEHFLTTKKKTDGDVEGTYTIKNKMVPVVKVKLRQNRVFQISPVVTKSFPINATNPLQVIGRPSLKKDEILVDVVVRYKEQELTAK